MQFIMICKSVKAFNWIITAFRFSAKQKTICVIPFILLKSVIRLTRIFLLFLSLSIFEVNSLF